MSRDEDNRTDGSIRNDARRVDELIRRGHHPCALPVLARRFKKIRALAWRMAMTSPTITKSPSSASSAEEILPSLFFFASSCIRALSESEKPIFKTCRANCGVKEVDESSHTREKIALQWFFCRDSDTDMVRPSRCNSIERHPARKLRFSECQNSNSQFTFALSRIPVASAGW